MTYSAEFVESFRIANAEVDKLRAKLETMGRAADRAGAKSTFMGEQFMKAGRSIKDQVSGIIVSYVGIGAAINAATQLWDKYREQQRMAAEEAQRLGEVFNPFRVASGQEALAEFRRGGGAALGDEGRAAVDTFIQSLGRGPRRGEVLKFTQYLEQAMAIGGNPQQIAQEYGRLTGLGANAGQTITSAALIGQSTNDIKTIAESAYVIARATGMGGMAELSRRSVSPGAMQLFPVAPVVPSAAQTSVLSQPEQAVQLRDQARTAESVGQVADWLRLRAKGD